jgi:hypothetical protein
VTKWQLTSPSGGPLDYPALGFSAVNGAILDGALSTPAFTSSPGPEWATYVGGSSETGVTRYAPPSVAPSYTPLQISTALANELTSRINAAAPSAYGIAASDLATSPGATINARILAASTAGGGVVWLPPGTFTVEQTIILRDKVRLCGAGPCPAG